MAEFNNIGLVSRSGNARVVDTLRRLLDFLSGKDLTVFVDDLTAELVSGHGQKQFLSQIFLMLLILGLLSVVMEACSVPAVRWL